MKGKLGIPVWIDVLALVHYGYNSNEITKITGITYSHINRVLMELRDKGIVTTRYKNGRTNYWKIPKRFSKLTKACITIYSSEKDLRDKDER